ncbi:hypothetical protein F0562_020654 [Nyssa sinensis]|uniref:Protein kinase domain-containing protein n=1 Tax=Nyssa sinensis TaxID=561372 RepID=A0A5J5BSB4_9ASTE|nr:hypothetical protein F0562_020654 [Nyssa sinensis]
MVIRYGFWLLIFFLVMVAFFSFCRPSSFAKWIEKKAKSAESKATNTTPVSLIEVKVSRPTRVIFGDEATGQKYDPSELAQLPKIRLGEGILGTLYKAVLNSGTIITIRKIREGLNDSDNLEFWGEFFGGMPDNWLLPMHFGFWYGGEAFVIYEYLCLGSLEELLHGSEGIQFSPLNWGIRQQIALCAAKALASIHSRVTKSGKALVCGVIKASNILIRLDFSACLSGYETPYLVSHGTIIRRNPGRVAPELIQMQNSPEVFTHKSDVYSFGILLLELITGKKPMVTNLEEYVKEKRRREGLSGVYDKRIKDVKENVADMLRIAGLCLSHNPRDRPSMDKVVQMIQGLLV